MDAMVLIKEMIENNADFGKSELRKSFYKAQREYENKMFNPTFYKDSETFFDKARKLLEREG